MTEESFNQEFCEFLEFHLSNTFRNSNKKEIKNLWCDGIIWNHNSKKMVVEKREIETIIYIGKDGQGEYQLKIKLGKDSLRRYAKGASLKESVPSSDKLDWIEIDITNKRIKLLLN